MPRCLLLLTILLAGCGGTQTASQQLLTSRPRLAGALTLVYVLGYRRLGGERYRNLSTPALDRALQQLNRRNKAYRTAQLAIRRLRLLRARTDKLRDGNVSHSALMQAYRSLLAAAQHYLQRHTVAGRRQADDALYYAAFAMDHLRPRQAHRLWQQLGDTFPRSRLAGEAWLRVGDAAFDAGQLRAAIAAYRAAQSALAQQCQARRLTRNWDCAFLQLARFKLGCALVRQRHVAKAVEVWRKLLQSLHSGDRLASHLRSVVRSRLRHSCSYLRHSPHPCVTQPLGQRLRVEQARRPYRPMVFPKQSTP